MDVAPHTGTARAAGGLRVESGTLAPLPPYNFARTLDFLRQFTPMRDEQELGENSVTKAIAIDGHTVAFEVSGAGTVEAPRLNYRLFSAEPLPPAVRDAVVRRISFFLSLEDDLGQFYAIARADRPFAPIVDELYGLHHVKFLTLIESGCWATLATRLPLAVSRAMKRRLVERYGSSIEVEGTAYWAFPELHQLVAADPEKLAAVIKNERRSSYLSNVISAFREVDEHFLLTAPYAEAEAWLRRIKGIGEWSAAFILLRGLGRMEQMPHNLTPLLKNMDKLYGSHETMETIAKQYGPWFGYWAYYLRVALG